MSELERLAMLEHPYYCSENNFYSLEPKERFSTVSDFLDEFEEADVDMNLVFRWDIKSNINDNSAKIEGYYMEIFMILQRKGIFKPIFIESIKEDEVPRLLKYLERHKEVIDKFWKL